VYVGADGIDGRVVLSFSGLHGELRDVIDEDGLESVVTRTGDEKEENA